MIGRAKSRPPTFRSLKSGVVFISPFWKSSLVPQFFNDLHGPSLERILRLFQTLFTIFQLLGSLYFWNLECQGERCRLKSRRRSWWELFACLQLYQGYPGEVGICFFSGKGQCICKAARWMSIQSFLSRGCSLSNTDLIYDASLFTYHLQPDVVADSYTLPWKPGWCANFQPREEGYTKRVTTLLSSCMLSSYLKSKWCFSMWTAVVVSQSDATRPSLPSSQCLGCIG